MKRAILIIILLYSTNLFSQEESFPCLEANTELSKLFKGSTLKHLYVHDCSGVGMGKLATSFLKPSGKAPKIIIDPAGEEPPEDTEYVNWTCKYSPGQITDHNIATAWVEGVNGYGIGEAVIIPCLNLKNPVEIWNGYGKSQKLYRYNSRASKIKVSIIRAKMDDITQYGTMYEDVKIISSIIVKLKDVNTYQKISIPNYNVETHFHEAFDKEIEYAYFLGIEILDVYKGSKWDDTCISEVRNIID